MCGAMYPYNIKFKNWCHDAKQKDRKTFLAKPNLWENMNANCWTSSIAHCVVICQAMILASHLKSPVTARLQANWPVHEQCRCLKWWRIHKLHFASLCLSHSHTLRRFYLCHKTRSLSFCWVHNHENEHTLWRCNDLRTSNFLNFVRGPRPPQFGQEIVGYYKLKTGVINLCMAVDVCLCDLDTASHWLTPVVHTTTILTFTLLTTNFRKPSGRTCFVFLLLP